MVTRYKKRRLVHRLLLPVFTLSVLCYFSFHALSGRYGWNALLEQKDQIGRLEIKKQGLMAEKDLLLSKINLLHHKAMEIDLVDEQARKMLGYVRQNELVIYFSE